MAAANAVVVVGGGGVADVVVVVVVADRRMDDAVRTGCCCCSHRTIVVVVVPPHTTTVVAVDVADAARWHHPGGAELPYRTDDATVEEPVADSASDWTVVVAVVVARKIRMTVVVVMVSHQLHGVVAVELPIARMMRVVLVPESSSWMVGRGAEEAVTPWIVVAAAVVVVVVAAVDRPMLVLVAKHLLVAAFPHDHHRIRRLVDWDC
jgi:hypothetical protein